MSAQKYGEAQKEMLEGIAAELSEYSHDDMIVEVKYNKNPQGGFDSNNSPGRDRRDTGH